MFKVNGRRRVKRITQIASEYINNAEYA
jgi:hypothetical protein